MRAAAVAPTVVFAFLDGEESPAGTPDDEFKRTGLRGSRTAAPLFRSVEAMVLLEMIGDTRLSIPRERLSDPVLWARIRLAAARVGAAAFVPRRTRPPVLDDHLPFLDAGVPAVNVIDFEFPCWHRTCDDLTAVSQHSLDVVGETLVEFLRRL